MLDDEIRLNDLKILGIGREHAINVINLPVFHKDPFDRMLISQAIVEKFTVVTADPVFSEYDVEPFW